VTEINAGRFSSATNILDLAGRHNMAVTFVRQAYEATADYYMIRDLDMPTGIFHADAFFDGIVDGRGSRRVR
jgi:hypothetical protein